MKKTGKSYFITMIVLSMMLVLAACGSGQSAAPSTSPATGSQGAAPANNPSGAPLNLTMYGGSPGGIFTLAGEGVGNVIRKNIANSQYNLEPGNPLSNIMTMASGKNPMGLGLAQNMEIKVGLDGVAPFKEKVSEVLAIGTIFNTNQYQFVLSKEFADKYGIKSLEDIAAKKAPLRIVVLPRGNLIENLNRAVLESYGITYEKLEQWGGKVFYENINTAVDMIKNGKLDAYAASPSLPDSKLMELVVSKPVVLMGLNENAQKVLGTQFDVPKSVIPAKSYEFQTQDIPSISTSVIILASKSMTDETAYTITKALVENIEAIKALGPAMKTLTPEIMAKVSPAKLHPGAEKYYKEKGIIK